MRISLIKSLAATIAVAALSLSAYGQLTPAEGILFKLGDDVQTVKNGLKTSLDPEPVENTSPTAFANPNAGKSTLFLRTKGIRVNFNKAGGTEMIKFEPPFAGSIAGIKLGDTEKKLRDLKGKPIKTPWQFGSAQAFLYALDDTAYIRFDVTENEGVQAIYIQK
jgi:hypothetical protein